MCGGIILGIMGFSNIILSNFFATLIHNSEILLLMLMLSKSKSKWFSPFLPLLSYRPSAASLSWTRSGRGDGPFPFLDLNIFESIFFRIYQNLFFSFKFKKPGRSHSSFPGFSDFALRSTMWVFSEIFEVKVFFRSIWHFVTWGPGMNWSRRTGALYTQLHPMFTVMFLVEMFVHSSWLLSIMDQMWSICEVALGDTLWKFILSLNRAEKWFN